MNLLLPIEVFLRPTTVRFHRCFYYTLVLGLVLYVATLALMQIQSNQQQRSRARELKRRFLFTTFKTGADGKPPRFLSLHTYQDKMRLGNNMWRIATVFGLASQLNWTVLLRDAEVDQCILPLSKLFVLSLARRQVAKDGATIVMNSTLSSLADEVGWTRLYETRYSTFDRRMFATLQDAAAGSLVQIGVYLQSYKYFRGFEAQVRELFTLKTDVRVKVQAYLQSVAAAIPDSHSKHLLFIAVHVRKGDFTQLSDYGFATSDILYIYNAMSYFVHQFRNHHRNQTHLAFVVCSDSLDWFLRNFNFQSLLLRYATLYRNITASMPALPVSVSLHYPELERKEQAKQSESDSNLDFAILSSCNHTVMTVGSYGFWAAYLAGGNATYYDTPFVPGSEHAKNFDLSDSFPPHWIPLSGFSTSLFSCNRSIWLLLLVMNLLLELLL